MSRFCSLCIEKLNRALKSQYGVRAAGVPRDAAAAAAGLLLRRPVNSRLDADKMAGGSDVIVTRLSASDVNGKCPDHVTSIVSILAVYDDCLVNAHGIKR